MKEQNDFNYDSFSIPKKLHKLVVLNDNHNSFENVIVSLIEICEHQLLQAEQCAYLVHHKGECQVKSGDFDEILTRYNALKERGLTVEIQ